MARHRALHGERSGRLAVPGQVGASTRNRSASSARCRSHIVPERPMQCSKTTTGCPVLPLTATCIPAAIRTRFQSATTFMLVHRAGPRNQTPKQQEGPPRLNRSQAARRPLQQDSPRRRTPGCRSRCRSACPADRFSTSRSPTRRRQPGSFWPRRPPVAAELAQEGSRHHLAHKQRLGSRPGNGDRPGARVGSSGAMFPGCKVAARAGYLALPAAAARWRGRYTVARETVNSSARSAIV